MSITQTLDRATYSDLPVAGWYDDPAGTQQLRWWGGLAWTEHVKPIEPPPSSLVEISTTHSYGAAQNYRPFATDWYEAHGQSGPQKGGSTAPIWILAVSPAIAVAVQFLMSWLGAVQPPSFLLAALLVPMAFTLGLIIWDRAALRGIGLTPCSAWWMLVPNPILYLIVRRVSLKRLGVISHAPSNVYVLVLLVSLGLAGLIGAQLWM